MLSWLLYKLKPLLRLLSKYYAYYILQYVVKTNLSLYLRLTHWPLGKFKWNFRWSIFKIILAVYGWFISYEMALKAISLDLADDKSALVQVMYWCRRATSHYLSQHWPNSMLPYGVTRPQWVNFCVTFLWRKSYEGWFRWAESTCRMRNDISDNRALGIVTKQFDVQVLSPWNAYKLMFK